MSRALGSTRAWSLLAVACVAALGGGCKNDHTASILGPTGNGGTLTATIGASATSGRAPIEVAFTSDVHGGQGAYFYNWTFGDAGTASSANPRVTFRSGGAYEVRLQVVAGDQKVTTDALTLRFDSDVILSCAPDRIEVAAPGTVTFNADARGGNGTFAYRWDFGDGTSSTAAAPAHTYASAGTFRQVLTVTSGGSSAICSNVVTVYGAFRLLSCKATPAGGNAVQFHATPSFCLDDNCAYAWDFGGGGSGNSVRTARPFFTYAGPGTYTATLAASTDGGRQAAACKVTVTVP